MTDDKPILVDCTQIAVIPSDDIRARALTHADTCLQVLRNHSGNVSLFLRHLGAYTTESKQELLFKVEQLLLVDKVKLKEWHDLKNLNRKIRFELIQEEVLSALEGMDQAFEQKETNKGVVIKVKEVDTLAKAKVVLGDMFAERLVAAKTKPNVVEKTDEENDEEASEQEALARAEAEE